MVPGHFCWSSANRRRPPCCASSGSPIHARWLLMTPRPPWRNGQGGLGVIKSQRAWMGNPELAQQDPETALAQWTGGWPALLKPEQGGSGARMFLLQSAGELRRLLRDHPELWLPDNLL